MHTLILNEAGYPDTLTMASRLGFVCTRLHAMLGADHPATIAAAEGIRANCDIDPLPLQGPGRTRRTRSAYRLSG